MEEYWVRLDNILSAGLAGTLAGLSLTAFVFLVSQTSPLVSEIEQRLQRNNHRTDQPGSSIARLEILLEGAHSLLIAFRLFVAYLLIALFLDHTVDGRLPDVSTVTGWFGVADVGGSLVFLCAGLWFTIKGSGLFNEAILSPRVLLKNEGAWRLQEDELVYKVSFYENEYRLHKAEFDKAELRHDSQFKLWPLRRTMDESYDRLERAKAELQKHRDGNPAMNAGSSMRSRPS